MGTGTAAFGKHSGKKSHMPCRRCGNYSYHMRKEKCSSCGFGNSKRQRTRQGNKSI